MGMVQAQVVDPTVYVKTYARGSATDLRAYQSELCAYLTIPWATPRLLSGEDNILTMERLTPVLELPIDVSRKYKEPLRRLLQDIHDAGFWHRDVDLSNVVIHPERGPLLVDWEWFTGAHGPVSYDLYGHAAAMADPAWGDWSVSWNNGSNTIPGKYWS